MIQWKKMPNRLAAIKQALISATAILLVCASTLSSAYYAKSSTAAAAKGSYPTYPKIDYGSGEQAKLIKRGEYLTKAGDCIACHTDTTTNGAAYAGGLPIATPFGKFYSPNITPDKKTGIGNWNVKQFIKAMRHGLAPDGSRYFPVFPYIYYNKVHEQDLRAIWAYLQTIPAVQKKNKNNDLPFPLSWRFLQTGWRLLYFYGHRGEYKHDPSKSAQWNRGAYLVQGLGHCGMCHTPLNPFGAPKRKYYLTGGFVDDFWAPNITRYGLETVTPEQVVKVFKSGEALQEAGPLARPMAEVDHDSLEYLSDNDLLAIATYLKTVISKERLGVTPSSRAPTLARGKKVYNSACLICHQEGKGGAPRIGDAANWFDRAKKGMHVLYRHTINGYNLMPIKGACVTCSDQDIEAAVDYLVHVSLTRSQRNLLKNPKPAPKPSLSDAKVIYEQHCAACHDKGKLGAPIIGDKKAWAPLIEKNLDVLITKTMNGGSKMPPKGGCKYCTTREVIAAVKYMVEKSKTSGDYTLW